MRIRPSLIFFPLILIVFFGIYGCQHDHDPEKVGYVLEYDWRECLCCGGVFIEHQSDTLLFPDIPPELESWINNYGFPLVILMDYQPKAGSCPNFYQLNSVELLNHN
jgi:hypothetical protein